MAGYYQHTNDLTEQGKHPIYTIHPNNLPSTHYNNTNTIYHANAHARASAKRFGHFASVDVFTDEKGTYHTVCLHCTLDEAMVVLAELQADFYRQSATA